MQEFKKMVWSLWQGLSGPQKLSLVVTFVGSLAVLAAVINFTSKPQLTLLYRGIAPAEAAKIVEFLQSRKIPHGIEDGGATINVPASRVHEVRLALAAQGIPRTADTAGGVGFEIFDKPTFGLSDFMQKANYYRALQGELARTIKQMDEVEDARVLIVVPDDRLFSRDRRESKASVFLQLRPGHALGDAGVQSIRFLVANGVENLQPGRVSIVDSSGRALASTDDPSSITNLSTQQLSVVRTYEESLREKAQSMLDQVLGPGQSVVRITAEMSFDSVSETTERWEAKGAVPRTETTTTETTTSNTQAPGGAAGVAANAAPSDPGRQSSNQSRETITNQYEIPRTLETRQRAAGTVRRVTTAVLFNVRRIAAPGGGDAVATPRTPQELKGLEELIKAAVGYTSDNTRQDVVQVREVEFTDIFASLPPAAAAPPLTSRIDELLPYASQGFLVLLAGGVLLYFRGIVRSSRKSIESREFTELLSRYEQLTAVTVKQATESTARKTFSVEEMQRLMREHPGNTAQAIKQWMTRN